MEVLLWIMIFVLGACLGSFVNMLVYRVAVRYELRLPRFAHACRQAGRNDGNRSFCDYCGRQLRWFENVPIISWLLQKGKTRCCGEKLPITYPVVEIMMGILFLLSYELRVVSYEFINVYFVLGLVIITLLVFSAVFDLKYMILPDFSTIILIVCSFLVLGQPQGLPVQILSIWQPQGLPLQMILIRILSAIGAAGFLLFLHLITKGKGMGMGDVKYALFMGMFLGPKMTVMAFYVAFVTGAIIGLLLMAVGKMGRKSVIPFGPFLIFGTLVIWFWGNAIGSIIEKVLP